MTDATPEEVKAPTAEELRAARLAPAAEPTPSPTPKSPEESRAERLGIAPPAM